MSSSGRAGAGPGTAGRVVGVGVDLVSVTDVRHALKDLGEGYLERIFTQGEVSWCGAAADPAPNFAAVFAAKEAVVKALRVDDLHPGWRSIEVHKRDEHHFEVRLFGAAAELAAQQGTHELALSLSHNTYLATAIVIATSSPGHESLGALDIPAAQGFPPGQV
ncbi:MAG TPA: holo-ACP synthase [Acidimicrobiales bacterium]|nr:holo-ACP synthase [Acidimicrobiales bacterium]